MPYSDLASDGSHSIRLSRTSVSALGEYLEKCDARRIAPDSHLLLSAEDRLTRDDIVTAINLCINIIRIGTTLVLPTGERFAREDINPNLPLRLALSLATLDESQFD